MRTQIEIFQTGTVQIRPTQASQPPGNVLLRRLRFLTDWRLNEPIPIFCFLIRHPEGNILFDLGETPRCVEPGYFRWWHIGQYCISMKIHEKDGLADQLQAINVNPRTDIKKVIMSHLHSDHAGGLPEFHGGPSIHASAEHWEAFKSPFFATIEGANPAAWPEGFAPTLLQPVGPAIGPWPHSYPVTADGKILAVDTPGHVPGHLSLIIIEDDVTYFLVGDAAYNLDSLDKEEVDGICAQPFVALETLRKIKEFCRSRRVVVLPSHEFDTRRRLAEAEVYVPT